MKNYILAHDLGTTGNKATLYDREGQLIGTLTTAYTTEYPETGWAEQNPNDWWRAVCTSTQGLLAQTNVRGAEIACLTFSGQMMGMVPLDAEARPLRSAIIWADQRATEQVAALKDRVSEGEIYRLTGHRLSSSYSLSKILWLRDNQPETFKKVYKFAHAKDAIIARLTGVFATEPSDASGMNLFDLNTGTWSEPILQAAGLELDCLPKIIRSVDVAGEILPTVADEIGLPAGTPVVIGGGDGPCAAVGAGSVRENVAYSYIGSSAWIASTTKAPVFEPQRRTFTFAHVVPGMFMPTGTMQAAGVTYQWMRDQLSPIEKQVAESLAVSPYVLMNAVVETSPPGANDLLFLPYLMGERSPHWNPNARGAFIGLTVRHTRADMIRAAMEGVAINLKVILNALQQRSAPMDSMRVIGGGVSRRLWASIMADVYGIPVHRLAKLEDATSLGAAVIGGVGIGMYKDFDIAAQMNPISETIYPNPDNRAVYDSAYELFEAAYQALEPIFERIASQRRPSKSP